MAVPKTRETKSKIQEFQELVGENMSFSDSTEAASWYISCSFVIIAQTISDLPKAIAKAIQELT